MSEHSRDEQLRIDRATVGLDRSDADELRELDGLESDSSGRLGADLSFELAAAAADLALFDSDEQMPELLAARIERDALASLGTPTKIATRPSLLTWVPLLVAAACLALLVTTLLGNRAETKGAVSEQRAELLARTGSKTIAFAPGGDPVAASVSGDVVWNQAEQRGVMRFAGLSSNDPKQFQYQLWIFDPARDERYPVDGGVFDIPRDQPEVLVPITAKLPLQEDVSAFVVTIERPGGVVVSDRSRIAAVAAVQ